MERYLAERSAHIASAVPGLPAARRLSEMTDESVRELAAHAPSQPPSEWALVALGGWGAGSLLPRSDLDLLFVSSADPSKARSFLDAILYPLWDAGLEVGHQVRSSRQHRKMIREDTITRAATLSARPLAGDIDWAARQIAEWLAETARRSARVIADFHGRPRPGSPFALEPDLKDGAGGRRDYDEIIWTATVLSSTANPGPETLGELGLLTAEQVTALVEARDVIAAARWALQAAGFGDRMTLDSVEALPSEVFERVQRSLAATSHILLELRGSVQERGIRGRRVPAAADTSGTWGAERLFSALDRGSEALPKLEDAAARGALDHLIPGFSDLMVCRRPALGHRWTVGAHSLLTAALVTAHPGDPVLARSLEAISDRRLLQVAALLHDRGKAHPGSDHPAVGAELAGEATTVLGLPDEKARDVADLVRLHLLLVETALQCDLDDEDTVLRAAAAIGHDRLLAPLHLLTAADSRATGPATWTPWTASLVGTLVARLEAALSPGSDGVGTARRGERVRREALAVMHAAHPEELVFVSRAPLRYLASKDHRTVIRHARLVAEIRTCPSAEAVFDVSPGPIEHSCTVTAVTLDRPEAIARLSGALFLAGMNVLSLDAHSTPSGVLLGSFVATSRSGRPFGSESLSRFERIARQALRDRIELKTRLAERERHHRDQSSSATSVSISRNGYATHLHVSAPDRPGLLHDVAQAIADAGVRIGSARIHTVDGMAANVFNLVDDTGAPTSEPGPLGHVVMRVREAL